MGAGRETESEVGDSNRLQQLGGRAMKTLRVLAVAAVLAVASAVPATAQEPGDSVVYEGDPFPVWVLVEDAEEAGAHRVAALVKWDDYRSILRFAVEVLPGELVVTIPKNEGLVSLETCAYTSALMAHGSEGLQPMERADSDCLAPPVEHLSWIAAEHLGSPMACARATRKDGTDPPTRRIYVCYWAADPDEG